MTITSDQARWFAQTFAKMADNIELAVLGKPHIVLADEINRASPKTQSALLEVMEEGRVTVDGTAHPVGRPFMVIATQNPIEQAGTYRLPEAQLDRFLMKTSLG